MAAFIFDSLDAVGVAHYPDGIFRLTTEYDKRELHNRFEGTNTLITDLIYGSATDNLPIAQSHNDAFGGNVFDMYRADFYERVHVIPGDLALGNLLSSQFREVEVFNAYTADSRNLIQVIATGTTDGIVLTEPVAAPTTFVPLESRIYEVNVSTSGPPLIDATYTFDFDTEDPQLHITGQRILLFTFEPNWDEPVRETLAWMTNIIETHDATEQAISLRSIPRRQYQFQVAVTGRDRKFLEGYMFAWKNRVFAMPVFPDCNVLDTEVLAGSSTIPLTNETAYQNFRVGELVILMLDAFTAEAVEVLSIDPFALNTTLPVSNTWPVGTRVYPVYTTRLLEQQTVSHPTDEMLIGEFTFELDNNYNETAVDSPTTYQGLTILTEKADRSDDPQAGWQGKIEIVDFDTGLFSVDIKAENPDFTMGNHRFLAYTKEKAWEWRQWLHARKGKAIPFYYATQQSDFELLETLGATSTNSVIFDAKYRDLYAAALGKRDFALELNDGNIYYRRITGAAEGSTAGKENLFFDTQIGVEVAPSDIKKWSFLHPVRLDTDAIELTWYTNNIVVLNFPMRGMRL